MFTGHTGPIWSLTYEENNHIHNVHALEYTSM
jgi:hypothetical protein